MAAFDTTRPAASLSAGRISAFFMNLRSALAAWNDARITRKALSQLSARELEDIGLSYGDIDEVAARVSR
ncbi:MAG: DUF1127 domain-containing protein [Pseudomonadota bacterium]